MFDYTQHLAVVGKLWAYSCVVIHCMSCWLVCVCVNGKVAASAAKAYPSLRHAVDAMTTLVHPATYQPCATASTQAVLRRKFAVFKLMQKHQREYALIMSGVTDA